LLLFALEKPNSRVLAFLRVRIGSRQDCETVQRPLLPLLLLLQRGEQVNISRARSYNRRSVPIFSRGECVGVARNSVAWRHRAGVDRRSVVCDCSQLLNWFFDPHKRHECLT
jgi:hypothetical protein